MCGHDRSDEQRHGPGTRPGAARPGRPGRAGGRLGGVAVATATLLALAAPGAAADQTTVYDETFSSTDSARKLTIGAGIHRVTVTAVGGWGKGSSNAAGGRPQRVEGVVTVTPFAPLYVVVGGNGSWTTGGFNGGGSSYRIGGGAYGSGGGGASDVRTILDDAAPLGSSASLHSRLLVAAGGGGAGGRANGNNASDGGAGGAAEAAGAQANADYPLGTGGFGGLPGGPAAGGDGGAGGRPYYGGTNGQNGAAGTLGQGGDGGEAPPNRAPGWGGGGGGGLYGGGGGGGGAQVNTFADPPTMDMGGGGGGGGSSLVPTGGTAVVVPPDAAPQPTVRLRYTAPGTEIDAPSGPIASSDPSFGFTATEDDATFECRIVEPEDQEWAPCVSGQPFPGLSDGPYRLQVRAVAPTGNADPTPAEAPFVVDTVAPTTTITTGPAGATPDRRPTFGFTADEDGVTFACRIDAAAFAPCRASTGYRPASPLAAGAHTFAVRATDAATNVGAVATRSFVVQSSPPGGGGAAPGGGTGAAGDGSLGAGGGGGAVGGAIGGPLVLPAPPVGSLPAKLRVDRARVRHGRLEVRARMTTRANGERVRVDFVARGRHLRFSAVVRDGRLRFERRLRGRQRTARSGILTLRYDGHARVRSARVRLRVDRRSARLKRTALSLRRGRLSVAGTIARRARGSVRFRLTWDGGHWTGRAAVRHGRWRLSRTLPAAARQGGYLTIQYTGYGPRRISGAQDAKRVAPAS